MQLLHFKRQKLPFEGPACSTTDWSRLGDIIQAERSIILAEMEHFFACPYCCQQISMLLDTSVRAQIYVEDCEVCCHPIGVQYTAQDGAVCDFEATTLE